MILELFLQLLRDIEGNFLLLMQTSAVHRLLCGTFPNLFPALTIAWINIVQQPIVMPLVRLRIETFLTEGIKLTIFIFSLHACKTLITYINECLQMLDLSRYVVHICVRDRFWGKLCSWSEIMRSPVSDWEKREAIAGEQEKRGLPSSAKSSTFMILLLWAMVGDCVS